MPGKNWGGYHPLPLLFMRKWEWPQGIGIISWSCQGPRESQGPGRQEDWVLATLAFNCPPGAGHLTFVGLSFLGEEWWSGLDCGIYFKYSKAGKCGCLSGDHPVR